MYVQKPRLSFVLVLRVVAVAAWCCVSVILLPQNFTQQLAQEYAPALELEAMLLTRRPEEIFAAEDEIDWQEWVDFFCQTREPDRRRKGLVEIRL